MNKTCIQNGQGFFDFLHSTPNTTENVCKGKKILVIKFETLLNNDFNKFIASNGIDFKNDTALENNKITGMYNKLINNVFFKNIMNAQNEIELKNALNEYYKNIDLKENIKDLYYFIYYFLGNDERYNNIKKMFLNIKKQNSPICVISELDYNKIAFILYISKVYDVCLAVINKIDVDESSYLSNNISQRNVLSSNGKNINMYEKEIVNNIRNKFDGCVLHVTDSVIDTNINKINYIYYGQNKGLKSSGILTNSMLNEISKIFVDSSMKGGKNNNYYDDKYYKHKYLKYKKKYFIIKS